MDKLPPLDQLSSEQKDNIIIEFHAYIIKLEARILELEEEIKDLKNKLGKNSQNSHKPPSSDVFKKIKPISGGNNKKSGGQIGHTGHVLKMVDKPDRVIKHTVEVCPNCAADIQEARCVVHRLAQVFDIPELKLETTEHQVIEKECPHCGKCCFGKLPLELNFGTQYGPNLRSLLVYLHHYQYVASERVAEFCQDVFNHTLSEGVLFKAEEDTYLQLAEFENRIKEQLKEQDLAHADETSLRVNNHNAWLHVLSNEKLTYYFVHRKRGKQAMDEMDVLLFFRGTLVHDNFKPYFKYKCSHALCNAHHLRELTAVFEGTNHDWANKMRELLKLINKTKEEKMPIDTASFTATYDSILELGFKQSSQIHETGPPGKRKSHPKEICLLDRLKKRKELVLAFMYNQDVPFTNNLAERDIRMMKIKMKISGCFRGQEGAQIFCRIRSYISTMKKQGTAVLNAIKQALSGRPCSSFA